MKYDVIIIEKVEYELLKRIVSMAHYYKDSTYRASIEKLKNELELAKIVSEKNMPKDVVRFNSKVEIATPFSVNKTYQIVTPDQSNIKENKVSILAPMGLALFGYAEGDEVEWEFPTGKNSIKIIGVEQIPKEIKI
ncbi:transcription elongation factor GreAB [Salegentibacter sp. BLCTC]|uniref:GreA/GreB family elongation factor n=1 Tax=Salegentibacter maritimus TaxID=2794347 RepID=A0ABS0TK80_9FLAO|nr:MULTISPECIES: GreA/GreB family elongation factor [Salegentibacter]MBE7641539.1 transcription elongation factor GreAB [Salegentibacter sp. BLCTC]MBI6121446.1 GreA/GreB family elongation factor [Salegentibacter maritimus]